MTSLSLNFLGPFQVTLDEAPATDFRSDKVRALLAYLSMEADQPHRREALAGLLWPDMSDRTARKNLRLSIHRLRQTLADLEENPDHILVTRETVQFNLADCWLDVDAFEARLGETLTHPHRDVKDCPACIKHLVEAALIYRGDFLQGFHLDDSLAFSEWALVKREALHRRALNVLYQLAGHFHQSNNFEAALNYAWRQLELEPWREEAHRQVMEILARRGERSAALAQFHACRRILSEEFGVEPAEETIAAYDRIRLVTPGIRHNLPNQPTGFVGREEELHELTGLLDNPECRLLTIFGPGGIGKTRLALEAAGARVQSFLNGVFYVPLAPVGSPDFLVSAIAEALQLPLSGAQNPAEQLVNYLHARESLLILDNFEHLVEGTGLLVEILQTAPRVKLLVTSRERLNLSWDWCVEIEGLKVPLMSPDQVEDLEQYSAVQLFQQTARQVNRRFSLASVSHTAVVRICQLVEGIPLGIELAASGVGTQSCEEIAREVERNLDYLATDLQDLPARHRSLRATFERSWNLLSAAEQQGCANLSVFRGGFQREAAEAVAGAGRNLLKSLVDKSLLRFVPPGRYEFHELLRQFAAEKLATEFNRHDDVADRHCGYYISLLKRWEADIFGSNAAKARDALRAEIENVRAGWHWAVEQSRLDEIERGLEGLANYYLLAGPFQEGDVLIGLAVDHVRSLVEVEAEPPCNIQVTFNQLRLQRAPFLYGLGMYDQSIAIAERVVEWAASASETCDLISLEAKGQLQWGRALYRLAEFQNAQIRLEKALSLAKKIPLPQVEAHSWLCLGNVADRKGDYDKAKACFEQSLQICHEIDDRRLEADVHNNLAIIFGSQGDYAGAQASFDQSLHLSREIGDLSCQGSALNNLGLVSWYQGDYAMARAYREQALQIYLELGERRGEGIALTGLGKVLFQQGDYVEAQTCFERALYISREQGNRDSEGDTLKEIGSISWHRGDCDKARRYYKQALHIFREIGSRRLEGITFNNLGEVLSYQREFIGAKDCHEQALAIGNEIGERRIEAVAHNGLAGVASRLGEYADARELAEHTLQTAREITDRHVEGLALATLGWVDDRLGERITARNRYRLVLGILEKIENLHLEGLVLTRLGRALLGLERFAEAANPFEKALKIRENLGQHGLAMEPLAGLSCTYLGQGELDKALIEVEKIYSCLPTAKSTTDEKHTLCGVDDPLWIYWTCYRVFNAGQDPRATDSLSAAFELLTEWAERFAELDQQLLFKENVAVHREILNAWDSLSDAQRPRSAWQTPNEPSAASNVGAQDGDEG